ncbi:MAG: oligosaccharide repeat unit polymerase [Deltaproteobacteria bacterium]|uniref:oligosaccharide repeat unit polymerase n=1 Tax=Hydrosulfovibrio ferrireducens TaxID=2934181 RepID=UPI00121B4183|nr:MAG: oligosaccharide repeat unit polymerase [Deltaproteobacteria bacterium]
MKEINLSRPDIFFACVWLSVTILAYADLYYMGFDESVFVTSLITVNIASFFVAYKFVNYGMDKFPSLAQQRDVHLSQSQIDKLSLANFFLFLLWCFLFSFVVYKSGGVPILWRMAHINKSYTDFGVPTLSGFANMIRAFIFCLSIVLWLKVKEKRALVIAVILLTTSLLEFARANTIYLVLHGVAIILLLRPLRIKHIAAIAVVIPILVILFGIVEQIRTPNGSGGEAIQKYTSVLNKLPYGFTTTYLYLTTPVSNLYYAVNKGIVPNNFPYYTLQTVLPTILRDQIHVPNRYPIALRRESHNATTFYSPFIADYGIMVAGFLVFVIQFFVSWVHLQAMRGDIFYSLIYSPLFASIALSFFYNYFITLGVLLFPVITFGVRLYVIRSTKLTRVVRPHA